MSIRGITAALVSSCVLATSFLSVACNRFVAADPKRELLAALNGANVDGFNFSFDEREGQTIAALTNRTIEHLIELPPSDPGLTLKYTRVADTKADTVKVYRSEITRQGVGLTLAVTDLGNNQTVWHESLPGPGNVCPAQTQFESIEACVADFKLTNGGPILAEANRTCSTRTAGVTCCLTNGDIFSVHLVFNPTKPLCLVREFTPDLEGIVVRTRESP